MQGVMAKRMAEVASLKERVHRLRKEGKLLREISARVGVSKQRVHQILQEKQ